MNWILLCLIVTASVFTLTFCSTLDVICEPSVATVDDCVVLKFYPRKNKLNFLTNTQSFRDSKTKITFLWNSNLKSFPSGIFPAYKNLKTLNLPRCKITQIYKNAFKDAHKLLDLNLWSNKIDNWKNSTFYGLENLEILNIGECNIQEIPEEIFYKLINLRKLDLHTNEIVNVPKEVFSKLTKLNSLDLSFNKIQHLEEMTFASLEELTVLNLFNNRLSALSSNMFSRNVELRDLNLGLNQLTVVEDLIRTLSKLETLGLHSNHLTELNSYPKSVKELDITLNRLKTLLIEKNVEELKARNNQIDDIRATTDNKIKRLYLSENKLWSSNDIEELTQLGNLDLETNPLDVIFERFLKKNSIFMYLSMLNTKLMPSCRHLLMENVSRHLNFSGANVTTVYDKCLKEFLCIIDDDYYIDVKCF